MANPTLLDPRRVLFGQSPEAPAPRLGPDELESLAARFPDGELEALAPGAARVALAVLLSHNANPAAPPPAMPTPILVKLLPNDGTAPVSGQFVLDLLERPPRSGRFFELKRRLPPPRPAADLAADRAADRVGELLAAVAEGDAGALDVVLEQMLIEREELMARLEALCALHRDAVQNAVDVVQSKRLDFLEAPQESGILGSVMSFVVTHLLVTALSAATAGLMQVMLTGVFVMVGGPGRTPARHAAISAMFEQRRRNISALAVSLRQSQQRLARIERGAPGARNQLKRALAARAKVFESVKATRPEAVPTLKTLVEDAADRARQARKRLDGSVPGADGKPDAITRVGSTVLGAPGARLAAAQTAVGQTRTDKPPALDALPLDVAMKIEVQGYFDPWLPAAAASLSLLKQARLTLRSSGDLPEEVIAALVEMQAQGPALESFLQDADQLAAEPGELRKSLCDYYELLLWIALYRSRLGKVRQGTRPNPGPFGASLGGQTMDLLPEGDAGTMNLLRYLALRFFRRGRLEGEGESVKLVFEREELLDTLRALVAMTQRAFPKDGQPADPGERTGAGEGSGQVPVFMQVDYDP